MLVKPTPRNVNLGNRRFAMFNKERDISDLAGVVEIQIDVDLVDWIGIAIPRHLAHNRTFEVTASDWRRYVEFGASY